jgi:hypothetical protein
MKSEAEFGKALPNVPMNAGCYFLKISLMSSRKRKRKNELEYQI